MRITLHLAGVRCVCGSENTSSPRAALSESSSISQSSTIDLDQSFWNYGSPSVVRVLVRNSREFPDVVRNTEVEDGLSC